MGFLNCFPHVGQLLQRDDPGLINQVVFSVLHDANPQRSALIGDWRSGYELDGRIIQDLVFAFGSLDVAEALLEIGQPLRICSVDGYQFATAVLNGRGDSEYVIVIYTDNSELDRVFWLFNGVGRGRTD